MSYRGYPKIEMPFARDPENMKHIMYGTYRSPEVDLLKDLKWQWNEKVDGTNCLIHYDGHRVSIGGHTEKSQMNIQLMEYLQKTFGGDVNEEMFEQKFGDADVYLYGEGYGAKIQGGGGDYRKDQAFILFDVMIGNNWQPRSVVEDIAEYFGIEVVPIMLEGTVDEAIEYVKGHPKSLVAEWNGGDKYMEGVVGRAPLDLKKRNGERIIVKIKWKDFKVEE